MIMRVVNKSFFRTITYWAIVLYILLMVRFSMSVDEKVVRMAYQKAFDEHLDAIEDMLNICQFDDNLTTGGYEQAKLRLTRSNKKVKFILTTARTRYGINITDCPIFILHSKTGVA